MHAAVCVRVFVHAGVCVRVCVHRSHIGAQLSHSADPSGSRAAEVVPVIHLKYAELVARVEAGRDCKRRFVGGVMPDVVVRHWKQLGYSVRSGAQVCAAAGGSPARAVVWDCNAVCVHVGRLPQRVPHISD